MLCDYKGHTHLYVAYYIRGSYFLSTVKTVTNLVVICFSSKNKRYPPVVRPHAAVDHSYVFSDGLNFMDTLLIVQNGLLFLLCCQDNTI